MTAGTAVRAPRRRALLGAALAGFILLTSLAGGAPVQAQTADPELDVSIAFREPTVNIGDRVQLVVQVAHAEDILVTVPRPAMPAGEVLGDGQATVTPQPDGSLISTTTFLYQVFALGPVETGPVTVRWLREDGTRGEVTASAGGLSVVAVRPPGDELLRPLKPQLDIPGAPPVWIRPAAIAAAAMAVVGLLAAIVWWWRHRRPRATAGEELSDVPEQSARDRLEAIRDLPLADETAFQHYYGTIASVVRAYLGDRFGFNAAALTTHELERRMTSHGVDRWQARLVSGLLDRCDRAVYARQYPDPTSADDDLTVAYEIVELSRPGTAAAAERAVAS